MITRLLIVLFVGLLTFANAPEAQAADVGQAVYLGDGTTQTIHVILSTNISSRLKLACSSGQQQQLGLWIDRTSPC